MAEMPSRSPDAPIGVPRAPVIAITAGEPAGIGPDLCVGLAHVSLPGVRPVVIGDRALLLERAQQLALSLRCVGFEAGANTPVESGTLVVHHVPLVVRAEPGRLDRRNSASVLRILEAAADGCLNGTFDAMVTTPIHKAIINDAGYAFTGHTEFLAERTGSDGMEIRFLMSGPSGDPVNIDAVATHSATNGGAAARTFNFNTVGMQFGATSSNAPDAASFDALIAMTPVPVLVDFWAPWCGPCRMMAPEIEKAARRMAGAALVVKVDTDAVPELGERFGIRSIPTLAVFRNGREASRVSGTRSASDIEALVERA